MTRLEFAAAALLLALPASAASTPKKKRTSPPAPQAAETLVLPVPADLADAAKVLFPDPADQTAFVYLMEKNAVPPADAIKAVKDARAAGGDAAAVSARLQKLPAYGQWQGQVGLELSAARQALVAGTKQTPPKTDYPETPLVGRLTAALGKKSPAETLAAINTAGNLADLPTKAAPCVQGTGAMAQLSATAKDAKVMDGGPCTPAVATAPDARGRTTLATATPSGNGLINSDPRTVKDSQALAPPAPLGSPGAGTDQGDAPKKKGFLGGLFSGLNGESVARAGFLGAFGALMGSFAGPVGIVVGGLIGVGLGLFLKGGSSGDSSGG